MGLFGEFLVAGATARAEHYNDAAVGFVFELAGDWILKGTGSKIVLGQALPADVELQARSPNDPSALIAVALFDGRAVRRSCKTAGSCAAPLRIDGNSATHSGLGLLLHAIGERLERHATSYAVPQARGDETRLGSESVLESREGRVNVARALHLPSGRWMIEFRTVSGSGRVALTPVRDGDEIRWHAGASEHFVAAPDPGLYQLLVESRETGDVVRAEAWVLVTTPATFAARSARFAELERATNSWRTKTGVSERGMQALRRAALATLASDAGG